MPWPRPGALDELASAHLVAEQAWPFRLHDLLRAYAAEQLRASEPEGAPAAADRAAAEARLLDHYLHTCHTVSLLLDPAKTPAAPARPGPGPSRSGP